MQVVLLFFATDARETSRCFAGLPCLHAQAALEAQLHLMKRSSECGLMGSGIWRPPLLLHCGTLAGHLHTWRLHQARISLIDRVAQCRFGECR